MTDTNYQILPEYTDEALEQEIARSGADSQHGKVIRILMQVPPEWRQSVVADAQTIKERVARDSGDEVNAFAFALRERVGSFLSGRRPPRMESASSNPVEPDTGQIA